MTFIVKFKDLQLHQSILHIPKCFYKLFWSQFSIKKKKSYISTQYKHNKIYHSKFLQCTAIFSFLLCKILVEIHKTDFNIHLSRLSLQNIAVETKCRSTFNSVLSSGKPNL